MSRASDYMENHESLRKLKVYWKEWVSSGKLKAKIVEYQAVYTAKFKNALKSYINVIITKIGVKKFIPASILSMVIPSPFVEEKGDATAKEGEYGDTKKTQ